MTSLVYHLLSFSAPFSVYKYGRWHQLYNYAHSELCQIRADLNAITVTNARLCRDYSDVLYSKTLPWLLDLLHISWKHFVGTGFWLEHIENDLHGIKTC